MLLAFELLNKYKKDSKFIQKDLISMKKQSQLIVRDENEDINKVSKKAKVDVILTQEERHRAIAEKREKRKEEQKLKELESKK